MQQPAEQFIRTYILRSPNAYKNVLLFERAEQPSLTPGGYSRIVYKCRLCNTGYMHKNSVQSHCKGGQHQTNYAALQAMIALPSNAPTTSETNGTPEANGIDNPVDSDLRFY